MKLVSGRLRRPSPEELMMFVDGELDGGRAHAVEAYLRVDVEARAAVTALRLAGRMLAVEALQRSNVSALIADGVMTRIAGMPVRVRPSGIPPRSSPCAVGERNRRR